MSQTRYIKLIFVYFIALFCNLNGHAINLDSLLKVATNINEDTNSVKALNKIGRFYSKTNTDSSIYFYNKALMAAKKINHYRGYFNALNGLSWVYYLKKQYATSDSICNVVLSDSKVALINKYDCYYNLSYFRISQSKFADALNYLLKAQKIAIDENNYKLMCDIYNNFGNLYNSWAQQENGHKDKFRESLNYYLKADSVAVKYNITDARINFLLINLALAYENNGDEMGAERYYKLAFENLKNSTNQTGYALALANYCGFKLMRYESNKNRSELITCLEVAETAKKVAIASNFIGLIPGVIYSQASAYFELGDKERSIQLLNKLLSDSISLSVSNLKQSYELLYRIYESTNDYKKALHYHKLFFQFTDSMNRLTNEERLNDIEVKYKTDQKEKENQLLQAENLVSIKTIKEQETRSYIIITGLILALLFGLLVFRSNKQKQKANLALAEKNILIEAQKRETEQQKEIIETQQKEVIDSISYAQRIQKGLLASSTLLNSNLPEHFVFFKPKDIVSGDFYWASPLKNGGFALVTADSTGHGVPGAFMSLLNISFLNESINERGLNDPAEILDHTRTRLIQALAEDGSSEGGKDGMDCTLCCFDFKNLKLKYAAANNSFYIFRNKELLNFPADKMPVGKSPKENESFSLKEVSLQKGDIVYTLTDGLPDQFGGPKGKKFKYKQLEEILISNATLPLHEQAKQLNQSFEEWKGGLEQVDDVLIIGIKI